MGCPIFFSAIEAKIRAAVSAPPPAGHGTINVIGRVGYSAARASVKAPLPEAIKNEINKHTMNLLFISFPPHPEG
jgi:hypothetical protein